MLYNGSQKWTAATNIADLIPDVPGLVNQYKPSLQYCLIDENNYTDTELASLNNLVAAVFRLEHASSPSAVSDLVKLLIDWLDDRPDLRRMFAHWQRATLMRKPEYGIVMPQVDELQEIRVMLADKLEVWAKAYIAEGEIKGKQAGRQEGKQEGRQEGEALALQKLLAKRFGVIPVEITVQIANASLEQIEQWFDTAIDASFLTEVFK